MTLLKAFTVFCGLLLLVGAPAVLGTRQLSAVYGTGVLPQPGLDSLGSINTQAANPVMTPAASPAAAPLGAAAAAPAQVPAALAAPAAAPAQAAVAPVPVDVAVVAPAPASKTTVSGASFGAHAPAPGPSAARRRRVALRNSVFILDADYATLTIPDPNNPDDGTLELSGFSRHVSYFTDARGTGVRRSGRIPITNFANTTFPDARNATTNGTANASGAMPNAALYASDDSYYASQSDRLLRVLTLRGKPAADAGNSTLTFNVTVAPSYADDDVVTVYRVSFNQTGNSTGNGTDVPQVTEAQFGTTTSYESVALYVGNWWWGQETDAANVRRHEQRREQRYEQRQQDAFSNWYWP